MSPDVLADYFADFPLVTWSVCGMHKMLCWRGSIDCIILLSSAVRVHVSKAHINQKGRQSNLILVFMVMLHYSCL